MKYLFFLIFLSGCITTNKKDNRPIVLTSIAPYSYFIKKIAGNTINIKILVPPQANPHVFEPTAKELADVDKAFIWFCIGEPFEKKVIGALKSHNNHLIIHDLLQDINMSSDTHDRHVWLNPKLAQKQAICIADRLSSCFPEKRELFSQNLNTFLKELQKLDQDIIDILTPVKIKTILVSHAAFGYLCQNYGLKQIAAEIEGIEPNAKILYQYLEKAKKKGVKTVFAQPQHNNKGAQIIAKKLNLPVKIANPYAYNYETNLRHIVKMIATPQ